MTSPVVTRMWSPRRRLQPWVVYDLERVSGIVETRIADLTSEELEMVRNAINRMARGLSTVNE